MYEERRGKIFSFVENVRAWVSQSALHPPQVLLKLKDLPIFGLLLA